MNKRFQFIFLICNFIFPQWEQSVGTETLDMQAIISYEDLIFSGGATGTYKSINQAESFNFSNEGNDSNGPTRGFTYDEFYIYTCTSQGVFRSQNNGLSWESKSNGLGTLLSHGIKLVGQKIVHVSPNGVSISENNADSWSFIGLLGYDVRCVTNIEDTLFVGTNGQGLFKTIDWGQNWIPINNGSSSSNFRAIESKGNILFAGGQNGTGVFRSINFGLNWELLSNGISTGSYRGFAHNDQLIVAGSTGQGVFYSADDGDSWQVINEGLLDLTIFDLDLSNTFLVAATHNNGVFRLSLDYLDLVELGDINQDNLINVQDIILAVNIILNSDYNSIVDLNFDEVVDILDIIQLVNIVLH